MRIRHKLISNTVFLFLDWSATTVFSFLFWLIAAKSLNKEFLGIVSASINLAMMISGIVIVGLPSVANKFIPTYMEKKQKNKINILNRFSIKIVFITSLVPALMIFLLAQFLAPFLNLPHSAVRTISVIIVSFSFYNLFASILRGFQAMKKLAITNFLGRLAEVLILVVSIYLFLTFSPEYLFLGPLFAYTFNLLLINFLRLGSIPFRKASGKINKKYIMLNYALPAFIIGLTGISSTTGLYVILNIMKGSAITGIFTVAMLISSTLQTIPTILNAALCPITSQLSVKNLKKSQNHLIKLVLRYILFFSLPVAIFIVLFSEPLIIIFSRPENLSARALLPILTFASIIYGPGFVFNASLYVIGKPKIQRNIMVAVSFLFLLVSLPLTYWFSAPGMSLAYVISTFVSSFLSLFYLRKFLRFSLPWKNISKLTLSSLVSFGFLYIIASTTQNIYVAVVSAIVSFLIYSIILIPLKFYIYDDIKILNFVSRRTPIFRKQLLSLARFLSGRTAKKLM